MKSPWLWLLDGKLDGSAAAREQAVRTGRFDYDAPMPGLEVVDRYTLRIRLVAPDLRFPYVLAVPYLGAVARERQQFRNEARCLRRIRERLQRADDGVVVDVHFARYARTRIAQRRRAAAFERAAQVVEQSLGVGMRLRARR